MTLIISTWFWGAKYKDGYVEKLQRGLARQSWDEPYEFRVFMPEPCDEPLTAVPGCLARLRMFSPEWQANNGIKEGDRLVCLDLDVVITGRLDHLFKHPAPFVILHGANSLNPCPFNGSIMMLRAGAHPEVWNEFSLEKAKTIRQQQYPDDQGWLWDRLPNAAGWKCGPRAVGIYAFGKPGWPPGPHLPHDARIVVFPGWRDPNKFKKLSWIAQNWI